MQDYLDRSLHAYAIIVLNQFENIFIFKYC